MITNEDQARTYCADIAGPSAVARLEILAARLTEENTRQNLVAQVTLGQIWQRHIADSLQLLKFSPEDANQVWLDLGTGAGFPGLAIAAARPEVRMHLIESRRKRCEWLSAAADSMSLKNVMIHHSRLEAVATIEAVTISARAFAPLDKLLDLSARFSTRGTTWVLPKGRSARQELASVGPKQRKMFHVEQSLTDPDAGILIGKGRPTP